MKCVSWIELLLLLFLAAGTGCASLEGTQVLSAIQVTMEQVSAKIETSVVYVEVTFSGRNEPSKFSGLIVNADGTILIPTHLKKDDVQKISVWIDKQEYPANLLQSDERRSVCLLKIKPPEGVKLATASLETSTTVKPGEWVITVNSSGKEMDYQKIRELGTVLGKQEGTFDQVIVSGVQVGNGTVLVNLKGEIIALGMNNQLACLYDVKLGLNKLYAKVKTPPSYEQEKKKPWLGLVSEPINEDYATVMNLPRESILVRTVIADSAADKAGLKSEDLIVAVDDQPLTKSGGQLVEQFNKYLDPEIGQEVSFKVLRAGETKTFKCRFTELPEPKEFKAEDIGLAVRNITDMEYHNWRLYTKQGVVVTRVVPGSPAGTSESSFTPLIYQGDIIIELNHQAITNLDEFIKAVDKIRNDKMELVLVKIRRGQTLTYKALNLKLGRK